MLTTCARTVIALCTIASLAACAPMLAIVGYSPSVIQVAAQIDKLKLLGDGVSYVGSGKTISDRALSLAAGENCRLLNIVSRDPVCVADNAKAPAPAATREPDQVLAETGD